MPVHAITDAHLIAYELLDVLETVTAALREQRQYLRESAAGFQWESKTAAERETLREIQHMDELINRAETRIVRARSALAVPREGVRS